MKENKQLSQIQEKEYKFIIEGKTVLITLTVDSDDVFHNADGKIDCPLETVLRKNNFTLNELSTWGIVNIRLVRLLDERELIINQIDSSILLELINSSMNVEG
ncbi:hypothetical protein [Marinilactibacillus sp. Marseille-P9653]|uniref:hypothetical protein n=1 Tax=Marinilactibacillus sp. Marseille-P9653 TaxID=2866583 RepID=UPI001CE4B626|nr:hypothetical protein [Marinilactibacillus sp. Marseille-P9653]